MTPLPCRRHRLSRCPRCGLHDALCVCALMPRVRLPVGLILVQHAVELDRPTNTGRIAQAMIEDCTLLSYALRDRPLDTARLEEPDTRYLLLLPREDAVDLAPEDLRPPPGARTALVVLDGTWPQASHMARRIAPLRAMRCVRLPAGPVGRWRIRRPERPDQLCTLEAIIRAVALAGQEEDARRMLATMELIEGRMLYMKGMRPRPPAPSEFGLEDLVPS